MTNTPDQSAQNLVGVPHPAPARRVVVYAVKNGWVLDVDFSQDRQWVYTSLDRLAADVKSFLHDGKAPGGPLPAPLLDWQRDAIIAQRDAAFKARDAAIKELDGLREVNNRVNDRANDLCNSLRHQRDVAIATGNKAIKEHGEARRQLATAEAKLKILVDSQEAALKVARDTAYVRGFNAGLRALMRDIQ